MAPPTWYKIIPPRERAFLQSDEVPVLRQCLRRLDYHRRSYPSALLQFREELVEIKLLQATVLDAPQSDSLAEKHLAEKLLSLEGDFPIVRSPTLGSQGLETRILHYRLQLLGLYAGALRAPFSEASQAALQGLGDWLQLPSDSPELLRLTGHLVPLLHRLYQVGGLSERVVTFRLSSDSIAGALCDQLREERYIREKQTDLAQVEASTLRELEQLEWNILGRERAEWLRISRRRQDQAQTLQRLTDLRKTSHQQLRQLRQQYLQAQGRRQRELKKMTRRLEVRRLVVAQMKPSLKVLQTPEERRQLRRQIRAREKILEEQAERLYRKEKKWAKRQKKMKKAVEKRQRELYGYQEDLQRLRAQVRGLRFRFKGQLQRSLSPRGFCKVQKKIFCAQDLDYLLQLERDPHNVFLIRILQLVQWTNGYYLGMLDGHFAEKTFGAILEMTEDLPQLRLKYILTHLGNARADFWVLNIEYLLPRFCQASPLHQELTTPEVVMTHYAQAFVSSDPIYRNHATDACWEAWQDETTLALAYHGRNQLWAALGRVVDKLAALVWRGIAAGTQIFRNFVRLLYQDIHESVQLFAQSLDFLFGRRRQLPLSQNDDWQLRPYQYDTQVGLSENIEAAEVHFTSELPRAPLPAQKTQETQDILRRVAKWALALAVGTLTWPQLLLQLVLFCRKWFFRWLHQLLVDRRDDRFAGLHPG